MSNSYFKINKVVDTPSTEHWARYSNTYNLSLTAFVGNEHSGNVQLTIQTDSTLPGQSGIAYYCLNNEEIDKLIFGLLDRKLKLISATSDEQSVISPYNDQISS